MISHPNEFSEVSEKFVSFLVRRCREEGKLQRSRLGQGNLHPQTVLNVSPEIFQGVTICVSTDGSVLRHEFNEKESLRSQNTVTTTFRTEWSVLNILVDGEVVCRHCVPDSLGIATNPRRFHRRPQSSRIFPFSLAFKPI